MQIFFTILLVILGYLIGSIPWALIIGKVFFHKDIREYGSHNLGGTNAGRVLGTPIGIIVIVLDSMKAFLMMVLCNAVLKVAVPYVGLSVCIGHCFPIFAQFRGGKAVACAYGYLLGLGIFVIHDVIFTFVYPLLFFLIVLGLTKYVSLSSILSLVFETIIAFITYKNIPVAIMVMLLTLFVIYRHIPNINKIIEGKESKMSFIK